MRFAGTALAAAFLVAATTAALADDPMANTYGNTVTTKSHKTGAVGTLYFNNDMTYQAKATDAKGQPVAYGGAWSLKDGGNTICLAPRLPANTPGSAPSCSPLQKHNVGDSWSVTNDQGETFDVSLSAGR
ncbi:MAG TPA: hypothetical protein VMH86_05115 [Rhizomicrobium sp.]|nr:hypothetical protein [Rhizomicrobium sp.]